MSSLDEYMAGPFLEPLARGKCLEHVSRMLAACLEHGDDLSLVQARCETDPPKLHCWIEQGDFVYDMTTRERRHAKADYYAALKPSKSFRYDERELNMRYVLSGGARFFEFSKAEIDSLTLADGAEG